MPSTRIRPLLALALAVATCAAAAGTAGAATPTSGQSLRQYVSSGQYAADVATAAAPAKRWLDTTTTLLAQETRACQHAHLPVATVNAMVATSPSTPAKPTRAGCAALPRRTALVLDLDETALSNYIGVPTGDPTIGSLGIVVPSSLGQDTAMPAILDLYRDAQARGVAIFFITARPPLIELATELNLRRVGYTSWSGLSFKGDLTASNTDYKTGQRVIVEQSGYTIIANVGDQLSDLAGGYAERTYRLPNPFYTSS